MHFRTAGSKARKQPYCQKPKTPLSSYAMFYFLFCKLHLNRVQLATLKILSYTKSQFTTGTIEHKTFRNKAVTETFLSNINYATSQSQVLHILNYSETKKASVHETCL